MQNIKQLRNSLVDNYEKMVSGEMELKTGKELANTAGKILLSLRIELEYNSMMQIKTPIEYLHSEPS